MEEFDQALEILKEMISKGLDVKESGNAIEFIFNNNVISRIDMSGVSISNYCNMLNDINMEYFN